MTEPLPKIDPKHVVTAWVEKCSGPGWSNTPMWVLYRTPNGPSAYGIACIQPEHFDAGVFQLLDLSNEMHKLMTEHAKRLMEKKYSLVYRENKKARS